MTERRLLAATQQTVRRLWRGARASTTGWASQISPFFSGWALAAARGAGGPRRLWRRTRGESRFSVTAGPKALAGGQGGHPLTLFSTNPVQGMEVDGAPGSTTAGVEEGDGTPAACSNTQGGKGVPSPSPQKPKSFLMAGLPRSLQQRGEGITGCCE